jgi:hypothetical protein
MIGVFREQTLHETEAKLKSETEYYRKELSGYRKSVQDLTNQLSVSRCRTSFMPFGAALRAIWDVLAPTD